MLNSFEEGKRYIAVGGKHFNRHGIVKVLKAGNSKNSIIWKEETTGITGESTMTVIDREIVFSTENYFVTSGKKWTLKAQRDIELYARLFDETVDWKVEG